MKKILVFTSTFPSFKQGDATPPFVYELSQRLAQQWLDIIVLTPRVPWSKKYEFKDNMKIYRYPYFFKSSREKLNDEAILPNIKKNKRLIFQIPFLLLAWLYSLIKIVKKERIETIHSHWLIPQWLLACIYKIIWNKKIKILCTAHGSDIHSIWWKFINWIKKFILINSDHITVVSNYLKDEIRKLGITKSIDVISMWVDTDKFNPKFYDENIKKENNITGKFLLYVGRLSSEKWVNFLLSAMPEVIKKHPDIKLILIGSWPLEDQLKKQAKDLNIEKNLIWKWRINHDELAPYFATADIFILPSLKEGMPVILIEALSCWINCIVSDIKQNLDVIWKEWKIFKNGDFYSLENQLLYCIKNIKNENKLIKQNIIDKFSRDSISKKYLNILLN